MRNATRRIASLAVLVAFIATFVVSAAVALAPVRSHVVTPGPAFTLTDTRLLAADAQAALLAADTPTDPNLVANVTTSRGDSHDFLPAWRWSRFELAGQFNFKTFTENPLSAIFSLLGNILFLVGYFIWLVLRTLIDFGLTANAVGVVAHQINAAFAGIAAPIAGPIIILIGLPTLLVVLRKLAKMQMAGLWRTVIWFIIPLALMQTLLAGAQGDTTKDVAGQTATSNDVAIGTPAWFGLKGIEFTSSVGSVVGLLSIPTDGQNSHWTAGADPACADYVKALYDAHAAKAATAGNNELAVASFSRLWERAFASNWYTAQFGTSAGPRVACVGLDARSGASMNELKAVAAAAGWPANPGNAVFTYASTADVNKAMSLDACRFNGSGWEVSPGWNKLRDAKTPGRVKSFLSAVSSLVKLDVGGAVSSAGGVAGGAQKFTAPTAQTCAAWWVSNDGNAAALEVGSLEALVLSINEAEARGLTNDERAAVAAVRDSVEAFTGHNGFDRVLRGLVALIIALIYLWGLGPLALGAFLAQVGLVLLLMLLPITLVLLALPTSDGNRNPMGVKLARLTAGFMATKVVLTIVITLLMSAILASDVVLRGWFSGIDWIVSLLSPIAGILLVRQLLKAAGAGDLAKISGSMSMPAALAAASAEKGGLTNMRKSDPLRDKLGMNGGEPQGALGRIGNRAMRGLDAQTTDRAAALGAAAWQGTKESVSARIPSGGKREALEAATGLQAGSALEVLASTYDPAASLEAGRFATGEIVSGYGDQKKDTAGVIDYNAAEISTLAGRAAGERTALDKVADADERATKVVDRRLGTDALIRSQFGSRAGVDGDYTLNAPQRAALGAAAGSVWGVDASGIVVGDSLYGPAVTDLSADAAKKLSADQLDRLVQDNPWLLWSPEARARRKGEDDTSYVRRLNHLANEVGHAEGAKKVDLKKAYKLTDAQLRAAVTGKGAVGLVNSPSAALANKVANELAQALRAADAERRKNAERAAAAASQEFTKALARSRSELTSSRTAAFDAVAKARQLSDLESALRDAVTSGSADTEALKANVEQTRRDLETAVAAAVTTTTNASGAVVEAGHAVVLDAALGKSTVSVEQANIIAKRDEAVVMGVVDSVQNLLGSLLDPVKRRNAAELDQVLASFDDTVKEIDRRRDAAKKQREELLTPTKEPRRARPKRSRELLP